MIDLREMVWSVGLPGLVAFVVLVSAAAPAHAETPEEKGIREHLNGIGYSHRIDDVRDNKKLGVSVGKVGVEYLLDGGNVTAKEVKVDKVGGGLLNGKYKITVRAKLNGTYKEKHFKGVGSEYDTRNASAPDAEVDFVVETSPVVKVIDVKRIGGAGGREFECLSEGAKAVIIEAVKKVI